ncbi:MFS transporter [Algiphilus sp.]|uniref:MFS transporter n=1 Tax=Algiphilus sp. TaxID=1872431 RepID=UPI0025C282AF|nr:MFS transporter [Algiphilus sp.]MCK5770144.1 MFS transporter [Algiphilus sp.]
MVTRKLAPAREIVGWGMFDFANQAYTLLIITVIYGDLFTRVIVGDAPDYRMGNLLWSLALAASSLMVVVAAPIAGAIMDATRTRKRFLFASYLGTVATTALLFFVEPGMAWLGVLLIVLSNFFYGVGESFVSAFLPGLGPARSLGWISGLGWGMGYVGGLVSTAFALAFLGEVSVENFDTVRWVGPFAAVFFLLAAIPTFAFVRERGRRRAPVPGTSWLALGTSRVRATLRGLGGFRDLSLLMLSIFFVMAGIYIVISFAFIYGAQVIGWDESVRVAMFVTVQITATVGAIAFGFLQSRIGAKAVYLSTLALWIAAIVAIWQTPTVAAVANTLFGVAWEAQYVFLFAGVLSGLSLGSSQSAGRALVGMLTPRSKAAEMFGIWGMVAKLAAVFGMVGLGIIQAVFGLADAIVFCVLLFAAALVVTARVDTDRGEAVATRWREPRS